MWESRVLKRAFERLELHEGKLSRAVLRGGGGGDVTSLPDTWVGNPYAQLKGSWSCMKNGKPLFHHVLQCVSCWKKELPDGDCRQGRRDYTKCPGTRSRGTWAGDRCYPTASKVHRRQLVADARPDSAQKTGCQGHRFPIHRCTVGPRRHFDGRRESLHASTRGVPS